MSEPGLNPMYECYFCKKAIWTFYICLEDGCTGKMCYECAKNHLENMGHEVEGPK